MTDEELSTYLPHHGDRLRLRAHLQRNPQTKRHQLLKVLQEKLEKATNNKNTTNVSDQGDMRNPHRPYGNRFAAKQTRLIELGWIHKHHKRSIQVRKKKGGGTRKTVVSKTATKKEILSEAVSLFFPNGYSPKGHVTEFCLDLWDFSDRPIDDETTVSEMYEQTKLPLLRFYLATSSKENETAQEEDSNSESEVSDRPVASSSADIISQAMEISGVTGAGTGPELPDIEPVTPNDIPAVQPKEVTLKLHRGHLLKELIQSFKDIDVATDIVSILMVMPDGNMEAAADDGGVTRDALSEFWMSFYDQCATGTKFKVPYLRHDFGEEEWQSVAKILHFGWKKCGYMPVRISLPFLQLSFFNSVTTSIIDAFFDLIPEDEVKTLKVAITDFASVDKDELLDILDHHDCKTAPTEENILKLLQEIAHKEIIQVPMFIIDCFQPVMKNIEISEEKLNKLYKDLIPNSRVINSMLKFPESMTSEEQTVAKHLQRFVRELSGDLLRKFLRFCTGSDLLLTEKIDVSFVNVAGLARRPVAHTCSCLLELSRTFESYPMFKSEFMAVLESNIWVMDII